MVKRATGSQATSAPTKTAGGRSNPRHRRTNPWDQIDYIVGKDPEKHYVLVNPADDSAMAEYRWQGYEEVIYRQGGDGPRPAMGKTGRDGEVVTIKGQVLMEIPLEDLEAQRAQSMEHINARMEQIRKGTGASQGISIREQRELGVREITQYQEL